MDSSQLNTVLELAQEARDAAALRVARFEQQLQQAREHLQTLVKYSDEYAAKLQSREGDALDPAGQLNQRAFLAKLRLALETQQREVETREQATRNARSELALCQRKVKSLETLIERRAEESQRHAARREQRQTDEAAQRASLRNLLTSSEHPL